MSKREDRPVLTEPTLIRKSEAPTRIWGNEESGFISTISYGLSDQLLTVNMIMQPGDAFRSSDEFRILFDSQLCLYVLEGQYTYHNPETGEIRTAKQGEMLFLPEKLWHYGNNFGDTEARVLEVFSPPANAATLAHIPIPVTDKLYDSDALERSQPDTEQESDSPCIRNDSNAIEAFIAGNPNIWTRVYASTEQICFAITKMLPGQCSGTITAPYDLIYYVEEGVVRADLISANSEFMVETGDAIFIPANEPHRLSNHSDRSARTLLGGAGPFASVKCTLPGRSA